VFCEVDHEEQFLLFEKLTGFFPRMAILFRNNDFITFPFAPSGDVRGNATKPSLVTRTHPPGPLLLKREGGEQRRSVLKLLFCFSPSLKIEKGENNVEAF
jgi:hypothetical protein